MRAHLDAELTRLTEMLRTLMAQVLRGVEEAVRSLEERDAKLANQVISSDAAIDEEEVRVEEECLKILALHQPVADDLRYVFQIAKINHELERIGDLAANVAEAGACLTTLGGPIADVGLGEMLERSRVMVERSLKALVERDADGARAIWKADNEIDDLHDALNRRIELAIRENPERIREWLCLRGAAAALERMADHAVNIAKAIIYMVDGDIVRHRSRELGCSTAQA